MKAWHSSVPGIVTAWSNSPFRILVAMALLSLLLNKISVSLQLLFAHWNKAYSVNAESSQN